MEGSPSLPSPDDYYVCEPNVKARLRTLTESSTDSQRNSADKLNLDVSCD